ncbi:MAG TPA: hypothetical protein VNZ52_03825, partial [Candidatus Thermoplasmatota archaeon]|nr:hypothetical protein [Candidatus Thermoplasmatota archaeon]
MRLTGGTIALGTAIVVAAFVGSFVVLPGLGVDPLGFGSVLSVAPHGHGDHHAAPDDHSGHLPPLDNGTVKP